MPCNGETNPKLTKSYYHYVDSNYPLQGLTLPEIYEAAARRDDDHGITWCMSNIKYTHKQLYDEAMRYAKSLLSLGLCRGDTVLNCGSDRPEATIMFIACSSIGIKYLSPYIQSPAAKSLAGNLRALKPKLVLVGTVRLGLFMENVFDAFLTIYHSSHNDDIIVPHVVTDSSLQHSKNNNELPSKYKLHSLQDFSKIGATVSDSELGVAKSLVTMNEPCMYVSSSGSTGEPKRILLGASAFTAAGPRKAERYDVTRDITMAGVSLVYIDLAHLEETVGSFYIGHNLIIYPTPSTLLHEDEVVRELLQATQDYKPVLAHMDQAYAAMIVLGVQFEHEYDISSLKGLLIAANISTLEFKEKLMAKFPLSYDCYGLSEFIYISSSRPGQNKTKPQSVGKPYANTEVMIVNEKGQCVPVNTEGEILARSHILCLGYHEHQEAFDKLVNRDGWFSTGDCGVMDEDGDLRIVGRMNSADRIKMSGDVVYLSPIEKQMKHMEGVKDCAVVGLPTPGASGTEVIYCLVTKPGVKIDISSVRDYAENEMQNQNQWPWRVFFFESLPKTGARGKLNKREILAEVEARVAENEEAGNVDYPEMV